MVGLQDLAKPEHNATSLSGGFSDRNSDYRDLDPNQRYRADTTAVVYVLVTRLRLSPRPFLFACTFIADTASVLLPVSNPIKPTNPALLRSALESSLDIPSLV